MGRSRLAQRARRLGAPQRSVAARRREPLPLYQPEELFGVTKAHRSGRTHRAAKRLRLRCDPPRGATEPKRGTMPYSSSFERLECGIQPSAPAQPGIAADRCARAIVGFLKVVPALAAAECQPVGRVSVRMFASISQVAFCPFGKRMLCCYEETNQAWDERPFVPRGSVQGFLNPAWYERPPYADCGSFQYLPQRSVLRTPVVLIMVPVSAFSTLRGTKARYAEGGSVSVVQPSAAARITSRSVVYASTHRSINALAQHARAADAASRRARSCLF